MKTTIKRVLLFTSIVVILIVSFVFSTSALAETGKFGDNVYWKYNENTGELILSGTGKTYGGYNYNDYEDVVFYSSPFKYSDIKKLTIENGITNIGAEAFESCKSLYSVVIPNSVKSIDSCAFWGCTSLDSITIPANVERIGYEAFDCCYNLKSLIITGMYTDIEGSFDSDTVDEICIYCYTGSEAADYAESAGLNYILIDGSDKESIFSGKIRKFKWKVDIRTGVLAINGTGEMPSFDDTEAPWYEYRNYVTSIKLQEGITSIGKGAFYGFDRICEIKLPDSLTFIDQYAFQECSNLKRITIPSRVEFVEDSAFRSCESLEEYVFSLDNKNQSLISRYIGINETNVKEIILPESVAFIEGHTFPDSIKKVTVCNPNCEFDFSCGLKRKHTIIGFKGSTAELFAEEIGATFVDIETVHSHNYKYFKELGYCEFSRCTCGKENFVAHTDEDSDAVCDNCEESTNELEVNKKREVLLGRNEFAYFSFTPEKEGRYTLKLKENYDTLAIYDKNKKVLKEEFQGEELSYELKVGQKVYWFVENYNYDLCCLELTLSLHEHSFEKEKTIKATLTKNGKIERKCNTCNYVSKTTTFYYPKTITLSSTAYTYDGKNKTPTVTIKDSNGKKLTKNVDYKLSVASSRKGIGRYTVKVTFIGNYEGTKNLYFYIKPGKPSSVKAASQTTSSVKLSWSKVAGAVGYTVYRYSPSKKAYVKAGTTEGTSLTVKKLNAGTKYTFKVVAYGKTSAGKVYNSDSYTLLKTATKTKTPELTKVTTTKGKTTLTHTDVSGETGYTVYYSTKKDSGFKKYDNFKANTKTAAVSGLTSGKTYYFKVRAYKKTDSGYVYSAWSNIKGIKVK